MKADLILEGRNYGKIDALTTEMNVFLQREGLAWDIEIGIRLFVVAIIPKVIHW